MPPLGFWPLDLHTQGGGLFIVVPFRYSCLGCSHVGSVVALRSDRKRGEHGIGRLKHGHDWNRASGHAVSFTTHTVLCPSRHKVFVMTKRVKIVTVNDKMQRGYTYTLTAPTGRNFGPQFRPELTPKEMLTLGVFGGKYMTDCRNEFPASWFARARTLAVRFRSSAKLFRRRC